MPTNPPCPNDSVPLLDKGKTSKTWYFYWQSLHLPDGFTGTIVTPPITGGGSNGSMTYTNGVLTSAVQAT